MTTSMNAVRSGEPSRPATWERHLPLSGLAAVVSFTLVFVVAGLGQPPGEGAPAEQVAAFFVTGATSILLAQFVLALGVLFLLVFLASLFDVLRRSDQAAPTVGLGFACGVATAVLMLASAAPHLAAVWASQEQGPLNPATAEALWLLPMGIFNVAFLPAAVMMAAVAWATFRTRLLPAWFGWLSAAAAVLLLVPLLGWGVFPPVLALWLLGATVPVWRAGVQRQAVATSVA